MSAPTRSKAGSKARGSRTARPSSFWRLPGKILKRWWLRSSLKEQSPRHKRRAPFASLGAGAARHLPAIRSRVAETGRGAAQHFVAVAVGPLNRKQTEAETGSA